MLHHTGKQLPHVLTLFEQRIELRVIVVALVPFRAGVEEYIREVFWVWVVGAPPAAEDLPVVPGGNFIITQLFFDNHDFYDFRERCDLAGIKVPIVAGIMPITSKSGMVRMAELAAGARIPAALLRAVNRCGDDEAVRQVGVHWATEQCRDLLDHQVRGIHFYTLNRSDATRQIYANLGVKTSSALRA